ncbi:hypothetical protein OAH41_04595 [Paracoccaceae bacterium]|nr:hypothetical protein [Paracoccaceae bacterium]
MSSCESRSNFSSYVRCIKNDYTRDPGASTVKSLYARLAAIDEDFQNGSLSEVKARAEAYIAYDETVGAGNRARRIAAAATDQAYEMTRMRRQARYDKLVAANNCRANGGTFC